MIKKNKITAKVKGGYGAATVGTKRVFLGKVRKIKKYLKVSVC